MAKGVLVHARNLHMEGWDSVEWGDPARDALGSLPKLAEFILLQSEESAAGLTVVFGNGPTSAADGRSEGDFMRDYLQARVADGRLWEFPRFAGHEQTPTQELLLGHLATAEVLHTRRNTDAEVAAAAQLFAERGVTEVHTLTCASHAARCTQSIVNVARQGNIDPTQRWSVLPSDTFYPSDIGKGALVVEIPHIPSDLLPEGSPVAADVLRQYYVLPPEQQAAFLGHAQLFFDSRQQV
ncbi:MAG TPA: hypothetical protein VJP80_04005 [Candidatus Saccharimonadales bacterium]|nr:hypothetical protein [Candidatus Saccharimonadales bacterium]